MGIALVTFLFVLALVSFVYRATVVFHNDRDSIHYFCKPFGFGRDYLFTSKEIKDIALSIGSGTEDGGELRSVVTLNDRTSFAFICSKTMAHMLVDYARQQGHVVGFVDETTSGEYIV